jgi:uncharacterized membrane protein YjgN (DUF898 family)
MEAPACAPAAAAAVTREVPFQFTGSGSEYFRIWIVNLLFTLLTLGVYSAWAKVRRNRYFCGHTRLDRASFEYLAQPLAILKGRAIAVTLLVLYIGLPAIWPPVQLVLLLLFVAVLPWLVVKALAFRARHTGYRNLRFDFRGSYTEALMVYVLMPLLVVISFGLALPFIAQRQRRFIVAHSFYGIAPFDFRAGVGAFYREYLYALGLLVIGGIVFAALFPALGLLAFVALLPMYLLLYSFLKCRILNLVFNRSRLAGHGFRSTLNTFELFRLYLGNTLAIVATLGLFIPWARVRMARYRAARLALVAASDLDGFVAGQREQIGSAGDEMSEFFDMDIGL